MVTVMVGLGLIVRVRVRASRLLLSFAMPFSDRINAKARFFREKNWLGRVRTMLSRVRARLDERGYL